MQRQGRGRGNPSQERSSRNREPMNMGMLNEHAKKHQAEAERLQKTRENLMLQRTQNS